MKMPEKYPVYFERNQYYTGMVFILVILSGYITYYSFKVYTVYHIYSAFVCAISTVYLSWLYFNPFSEIHDDHFEIHSGLFSHKKFAYRDIQKIEYIEKHSKLILIFNDHESVNISIRLLRKKNKKDFVEMIKLHVYRDLLNRDE